MCNTRCIVQRHTRSRGRRSGVDIDPGSVRRAREEAGLSLAEVAGSELTRQAVHLIETGRMRPSTRTLEVIARRLGRPASDFRAGGSWLVSTEVRLDALDRLCAEHRYDEMLRRAEDLLARESGKRMRALALFYAGVALYHLTRHQEAIARLRGVQELAEDLPDPWLAAEALDWEAKSRLNAGDLDVLPLAEEALRRYRALQPRSPEIEARMLEHLATCLLRRRDFDRSRVVFGEALQQLAGRGAVRDLESMARIYHGLAGCTRASGDLRAATELMQRAVALYGVEHELNPLPARISVPKAENDLGLMLMELGQLERAERLLLSAHEGFVTAGAPRFRAQVLLSLGELRLAANRVDEAFAAVRQAVGLASESSELNDIATLAVGYRQLGELHHARGEEEAADAHFARALTLLDAAGLVARRAECQAAYERVLADRERGGRSEVELPAS